MHLILIAPLPFLAFHLLLFLVWYYGRLDAWLPIVLGGPVVALLMFGFARISGINGVFIHDLSGDGLPWWYATRPTAHRVRFLVELLCFYAVIAAGYWFMVTRFAFPRSLSHTPLDGASVLLVGYGSFFVLGTVGQFAWEALLYSPLRWLARELLPYRRALYRLGVVVALLLILDLVFACLFRMVSLSQPLAFHPQMHDFADALYLSTATITVFGSIDVSPGTGAARLLVAVETLVGVLVFAVLVAFLISAAQAEAFPARVPAAARTVRMTPMRTFRKGHVARRLRRRPQRK